MDKKVVKSRITRNIGKGNFCKAPSHRLFFFYLTLTSLSCVSYTLHATMWNSVRSWIESWRKKYEETITMQSRCPPGSSVTIGGIKGSIRIEPEWSQPIVAISARKICFSKDDLKTINIVAEVDEQYKRILFKTVYDDDALAAQVEYTVVIPQASEINVECIDGSINARGIKGSLQGKTVTGTIELHSCSGPINVCTDQEGSITIHHPESSVHATTVYGSINIMHAQAQVIAKSEEGPILVQCDKLPKNSDLWLQTRTGSINLFLPSNVNADIRAKTERAVVNSEIPITMDEITTLIDANAWKKIKKQVHGRIGSGNDSKIRLYSRDSAINIKKIKAR